MELTNHGGYCDYCKEHSGTFCSNRAGRDICKKCVLKAMKLFNIQTNNSIMGNLSKLAKRIFDKDTKTLIKAGYLNSDLSFTKEGEEAVMSILLEKNKADLVELANEELEEKKEEKE